MSCNLTYCEIATHLIEPGLVSSQAVLSSYGLAHFLKTAFEFCDTAIEAFLLLLHLSKSLLNFE